jgi:xylose isomerase
MTAGRSSDSASQPAAVADVALAYYRILSNGGFSTGGTNFDAKVRRQSLDPLDLIPCRRDRHLRAGAAGGRRLP